MLNSIAEMGLRARSFLAILGCAILLAACGGGGGDSGSSSGGGSSGNTVSGTAASGSPLAGITITVKDSLGAVKTATTSATGAYSVDTTGMVGPFLVRASVSPGTTLYSVSADSNSATTVNVTPLSDLVIRSWYNVQGLSIDANFAATTGAAPPTSSQLTTLAQTVLDIVQLAINNNAAPITAPAELINKPFTADHTGIDKLLDNLRITSTGGTVTLVATGGGATQTTVITYNTATTSMTANSTTTNGSSTSTASNTSVVPAQSTQAQAISDINAQSAAFASVINSKGTALTGTDLLPFLDASLLNEGYNRTQFANASAAQFNQGQKVTLTVHSIKSLDTSSATPTAQVELDAVQSLNGQTQNERITFYFKKTGGTWLLAGDQRIASISVDAEGRNSQGANPQPAGPAINFDVRPLAGVVNQVSFSGTRVSTSVSRSGTDTSDLAAAGVSRDTFFFNTGVMSAPLPTAGSPYVITLNRASGGPVSYTFALNSFTTELIRITNLTGTTLADAKLGQTLAVAWTLPSTYAVSRVQLSAQFFDGTSGNSTQCGEVTAVVSATSTTGTLSMPAACLDGSGKAIRSAYVNVNTRGVNGERSMTSWFFQ